MANKQAQVFAMYSKNFSDKGRAIKGLVVWWILLNLIYLDVSVSYRQLKII